MSRITDHLTCVGAGAMELGAFTAVPLLPQGARVALRAARGGLGRAPHAQLRARRRRRRRICPTASTTSCTLCLDKIDRRDGRGRGAAQQQQDLPRPHGRHRRDDARTTRSPTGCDGPIARARRGVDYDVRKDHPYSSTTEFEFDVPLGTTGDCYDRYLVRVEEMQAVDAHPASSALKQIPDGPVMVDDPRVVAAAEDATRTTRSSR